MLDILWRAWFYPFPSFMFLSRKMDKYSYSIHPKPSTKMSSTPETINFHLGFCTVNTAKTFISTQWSCFSQSKWRRFVFQAVLMCNLWQHVYITYPVIYIELQYQIGVIKRHTAQKGPILLITWFSLLTRIW